MAQNEMREISPSPPARFWRLDLNHPTLWQTALLIAVGFTLGAMFGFVFS